MRRERGRFLSEEVPLIGYRFVNTEMVYNERILGSKKIEKCTQRFNFGLLGLSRDSELRWITKSVGNITPSSLIESN